jgi:aspartate carbamoyltransferase catalytic subunit
MNDRPLIGPNQQPSRQEHPAAGAERAALLTERVPDRPEEPKRLHRRHFTSVLELDAPLVRQLLRSAARFESGDLPDSGPARCKVLSNLFLDRSHCTGRLSFNAAWLRLGGNLLQIDQTVEQILSRRYAPDEIAELCNSYADMAVLRTGDEETFRDMLPRLQVPIVNAGNGTDEHPSHALADLYLLAKWRPSLLEDEPPAEERLGIGVVGDPTRTRTLRSFLRLLTRFPNAVDRVVLMDRLDPGVVHGLREELQNGGLRVQTVNELFPVATDMDAARELLPTLDLIYVHHLQPVHVSRMKILEGSSLLGADAMILNPEIQNEEAASRFNDSPHNGYFAQARGSVFVRMALFAAILG